MKTLITYFALVLLVLGSPVFADTDADVSDVPYTGSDEFERLKGLAGSWQGSSVMQGKEQAVQVEYRVTSAGSALVETLFPGTPHEMVSVYHDQAGKPGMTHYCAMKNRPNLAMDDSSVDSIHFDFIKSESVDADKDAHMHELTIRFIGKDRIEQEWVLYEEGKAVDTTRIELQRI